MVCLYIHEANVHADELFAKVNQAKPVVQLSGLVCKVQIELIGLEVFPAIATEYRVDVFMINRDFSDFENRFTLLNAIGRLNRFGTCDWGAATIGGLSSSVFTCPKSLLFEISSNFTNNYLRTHWVVYPLLPGCLSRHRLRLNSLSKRVSKISMSELILSRRISTAASTSYVDFKISAVEEAADKLLPEMSTLRKSENVLSMIPSRVIYQLDPEMFDYQKCLGLAFSPNEKYISVRAFLCVYVIDISDPTGAVVPHAIGLESSSAGQEWLSETSLGIILADGTKTVFDVDTGKFTQMSDSESRLLFSPDDSAIATSSDDKILASGRDSGVVEFSLDSVAKNQRIAVFQSPVVLPVNVSVVAWKGASLAYSGRAEVGTAVPVIVMRINREHQERTSDIITWGREWIAKPVHGVDKPEKIKSRIFSNLLDKHSPELYV